MDFLDALQPQAPYDATVTLTGTLAQTTDNSDLSAAHLEQLETELHDLWLDALRLNRRSRELAFSIVGHNEIVALNGRLATVQALNLTQREYHRSAIVSAWPTPPIPTGVLLSTSDLLPYLSAALAVMGGRHRLHPYYVDGSHPEPVEGHPEPVEGGSNV